MAIGMKTLFIVIFRHQLVYPVEYFPQALLRALGSCAFARCEVPGLNLA
jgi:hypothetical protein